jgi:Domain of Unknown Function (DUF1599).
LETKTNSEYTQVISRCKELFRKKTLDYGTSWRIMRLASITDQIFIKAQRIRSVQEKGSQKINDPLEDDFVGIINYSLIALIQISFKDDERMELPFEELEKHYDQWVDLTRGLLENKNHDYGEAWRDMRVSSMTDIILMKLLRLKQIEDNQGKTLVSEGIEANYQDMINYAVFCLIKMGYHHAS